MMRATGKTTIAIVALLLGACATVPPTPKLAQFDPASGYRYELLEDPGNSEELFVILTFSGGGTRAGALSYGVLEKLKDTWVTIDGKRRNLLKEVDVISSVSGGSFTSAYYTLHGDAIFEPNGRFQKNFLYKDVESELTGKLWNPVNWFRLMSPTFGRIELAQETYEELLFDQATYADLVKQKRRPFLMVNATDMTKGVQFTFMQSQFDPMCSDLTGVPIARAVAASSNFPIAFTPLAINAYPGGCAFKEPGWVNNALKDVADNPWRYYNARTLRTYQEPERQFAHLLDGGVADNIGLRGPMASLFSNDVSWSVVNKMNLRKIKTLVVIVVDAKNQSVPDYDQSPDAPGLTSVVNAIATVPLDNYSFDTVELLRQIMVARARAQRDQPSLQQVDLYRMYVGFDRIRDDKEREKFLRTPTTFNLPAKTVDALRKIGGELLQQDECFKKLTSAAASGAKGKRDNLCPF